MKYYLFLLGQWVARYVPRPLAYWVGLRVSDLYFFLSRRSREGVIANLHQIFTHEGQVFSRAELRALARETFHNFGKHVVEFFRFQRMQETGIKQLVTIEELNKLDQLLQQNRGVIIVTAHFGNWELAGGYLATHGYKVNAVALFQPGQKLNALFQRQRMARGVHVIPMGNAALPCLRALHRNEIVALLADRDFTSHTVTVNFFGQPARLPRGPARLAQVTGAPILSGFIVRQPDDTFRLALGTPIFVPRNGVGAVQQATEAIAQQLQFAIRQYPTQWFIFYNFWNLEEETALAREALAASVQTLRQAQHAGSQRTAHP